MVHKSLPLNFPFPHPLYFIEHKSKRVAAADRYKIQKKIRDHHRKARKGEKSNPTPKRKFKDPGIPNAWPYKESLLMEIEERRQKLQAEKEEQKAERQKKFSENRTLTDLFKDAEARDEAFEASRDDAEEWQAADAVDATASGLRDNSRKAYYKEFRKVVENADVILEVLDARDPLGCRTRKIEEMILQCGTKKRIILILNKVDLVPRHVVAQWLKYLRNEYPTVAFKASTQQQRSHLEQSQLDVEKASDRMLGGSGCVGADQLVQLLKNYSRSLSLKTAITVGVIGYPNVGKSSVINSLKRSKVCAVGSTPGLTKASQEISLDKNLKLLDCPGIVFSQSSGKDAAESILRNCVKVEMLDDPVAPVEVILRRCKMEQLMTIYNIPPFLSVTDFLIHIARVRGRLRKGGVADLHSAAVSVLQDWNKGRIAYYTVPPVQPQYHISTEIVQSWSKEFKLDDLISTEEAMLDQMDLESPAGAKFVPITPGQNEEDLDAIPIEEENEDDEMDGISEDECCPSAVPLQGLHAGSDDQQSIEVELSDAETAEPQEEEQVIYHYAEKKHEHQKKKVQLNLKPQVFMTEEEAALEGNQQRGKNLKKQLKKEKKRKGKSSSSVSLDGDVELKDTKENGDTYDFGDYHKIR